MKTTALDFLLCTFFGCLLFAETSFAVWWLSDHLIVPVFGGFYKMADAVLFCLLYGIITAVNLRILLKVRPFQLGEFEMDHPNFTYWKLRIMAADVGKFFLLPFTIIAVRPLIAKLYGGIIGKDAALGGIIDDPSLVSVGARAALGINSVICTNMTVNGKIKFGRVTIGNEATIGVNAVILPDVVIGDGAVVGVGAVVLPGTRIPAGEQWRGNPARKWQ